MLFRKCHCNDFHRLLPVPAQQPDSCCRVWKLESNVPRGVPPYFLYAPPFPLSVTFSTLIPSPLLQVSPSSLPSSLRTGMCLSGILSLMLGYGSVQRNFWLVSLTLSLLTFLRGALKLSLGIPCVIHELTSSRGSYPLRIGQRFLRQVSMVLHLKSCLLEIDVNVEWQGLPPLPKSPFRRKLEGCEPCWTVIWGMGTGLGGDWNALNYASDPLFQLLKGKHSPPSTLATHMCLCSPSQSQAAPGTQPLGTQCPFWGTWWASPEAGPWSVGLGLRSPASCPFHRILSYRLTACLQTDVLALLWNYSMGCPCPSTKPLPLIPLGD